MNDEYTHSMQSPLEGPKYIKKSVQNQNKIEAQHSAEPVSLTFHSFHTEPSIAYRCFQQNFGSFWQSSFREDF
jgi:hypothetical protein